MGCLTAKASGSIASFINPTVTDIESARVYFNPTQLGSGTPSPDNVREIVGRTSVELKQCGKNLIDINTATKGRRINIQGEEVAAADYCFSDYVPVLPLTQYYLFNAGEMAANARTGFYDSDKQLVATTSKIDPITTTEDCAYIRCSFRKENLQIVQLHRYDDIKTIPFSWKRLPDEYQEVEYIESDGGQYIYTDIQGKSGIECSAKVMWLSGNDTSIFGARKSDSNRIMLIHQYPSKKWTLGYGSSYTGISNITYNTPYNVEAKTAVGEQYLKVDGVTVYEASDSNEYNNDFNMAIFACSYSSNDFRLFASARVYNLCVKNNDTLLGNFIPCYHKSDNEIGMYDTVSQTFYTNQGTGTFTKGDDVFSDEVYGGYVDLVSGELWADHAMFTVDEPDTTCTLKTSSRLLFTFPLKYYFSALSRKGASMCTILPENASANWNYGYIDNISATATTGNHQLYLNYVGDGDGWSELVGEEATVENVKAYLRNIGFAICATLRTPILMRTLTPQQLQTLKNENTFWSDGDSVEIDYDLAETFDIQKAKRKIIMNQPHVESASNSPSSPQVIKFKTDMKAPLKQCIVNFTPIQEGSGDPSPTNIRPIKGWNGITLKHTGINMLQCNSPSYYIDATNNGITSQSSKNADNEIIGIDFNGTTTSTNIFRNLNYNPNNSGAVTMPRGLMGLTGYSDQVYIVPMGNGNAPRTTDGRYWTGANTNSENGWNVWSVDSSETYNGLWVRTQVFPRESNVNVDTTVYPMMCLAEDVGCEFEPYKGETFDIDWTDDAGTVYGGYIDLVKGELVAEWIERMINSFDWSYNSSGECFRASTNIKGKSVNAISPIQSKIYKTTKVYNSISYWLNVDDFSISEHTGISSQGELINSIHIKDSRYTTVSDFLNGVGNESIIYELAEPIHYSLTPQEIIAFKGQNNIWANTNKLTEIKYWNHKKSDSTGVIYEAENLAFDGTNYIDTGVYLFSEENINRDFEVVIEDLYGNYETGSRTIVCAKYDSEAIGFLIRLNDSTSITYNGTISMKASYNNNITIGRINGVITCEGSIINNPKVKFTNTVHNHPLVLGCALQDDGTPFRYATGTIGHIIVKWL